MPMSDGEATAVPDDAALPVGKAADLMDRITDNVERVIVGHHDAIEHIVVTMLARGHLLLEIGRRRVGKECRL